MKNRWYPQRLRVHQDSFGLLCLSKKLQIRDVDPLQYFLGIEVLRQAEGIFLGQKTYALDLLKDTGLLGATPAKPPIEISLKLHPKEVSHQKTSRGIEDY